MTRPLTNWHAAQAEELTTGQRAADRLRNGMGSWPFIGGFIVFMIAWAVVNITAATWDPYPFILLNLFLSMLAGLQGAILLIAAKRQDAIAAALAQHDFDTNVAAKKEIEELMAINRLQLELLTELRARFTGDGSGSSSPASLAKNEQGYRECDEEEDDEGEGAERKPVM